LIEAEIAIVGGGIAGVSAAAELASERRVVLLEREDQPGHHASGRSAALFSETYGNAIVRALSAASRSFLAHPAPGFATFPLLSPRGALHVGVAGQEDLLAHLLDEVRALVPAVRALSAAEARAIVPVLRQERLIGGVLEPDARDIDTNALLQGYIRAVRQQGGQVVPRAEVTGLERTGHGWMIRTRVGVVRADIVVDAGGAWADAVAGLAGLAPLGLLPKRRTAFAFDPPPGIAIHEWPLVIGAAADVYFKPDAGMILGSPADEIPSEPNDAQPDELDVAVAVARIEALADLPVRRIVRRWAGLRTFAPDRTPVVGFDPRREGFFWLAGQGGYGFQTAPSLARVAAGLILRGEVPRDILDRGVTRDALAPDRLL